eukprot:9483828-Pyramimonas_sp.AAC.1
MRRTKRRGQARSTCAARVAQHPRDTGCAAPWKVTDSSPHSAGRAARGGPRLLVPPESSVTRVANAGEFAADEVAAESFVL